MAGWGRRPLQSRPARGRGQHLPPEDAWSLRALPAAEPTFMRMRRSAQAAGTTGARFHGVRGQRGVTASPGPSQAGAHESSAPGERGATLRGEGRGASCSSSPWGLLLVQRPLVPSRKTEHERGREGPAASGIRGFTRQRAWAPRGPVPASSPPWGRPAGHSVRALPPARVSAAEAHVSGHGNWF